MYLTTLIFILAFIFVYRHDNRSYWNPPLFILSIGSIFLSIMTLTYHLGFESAHDILFLFAFIFIPLLIFISAFLLIYNGFVLLKREGKSLTNLLSLLLGIAILLFFALMYYRFSMSTNIFTTNPILNTLFILVIFSYFIFGIAFIGYMSYSILYLFIPKNKNYDFIIIHGAGLYNGSQVTPLLKKRIDKAVEAYHQAKNPNIKLIVSGGKGSDEKISEAQAMRNYLLSNTTIPEDRILLEDKSKTTYENLLYSKQLGKQFIPNPTFLFVTNDYHIYRTSAYAKQIGMHGDGLGCKTASYYIPSAFIREFIALCVKLKWVFIMLYIPLILLIIISYRGIYW